MICIELQAIQAYSKGNVRMHHGGCEEKWMNPKLG